MNPDPKELLELRAKTSAWINDLRASGISEAAIVTGIHQALIEMALLGGGAARTATWLRSMAKKVEIDGPALIAELRKQAN